MKGRPATVRPFRRRLVTARQLIIVIALLVLAAVGVRWYLLSSQAAPFQVSAEAENGTHPNTSVVADSKASNGQALKFGGGTGGGGGSCIAPAGLKETDIDTAHDGDPIPAWRHTLGSKATIYYQTGGIPAEYAGYVQDGANIWNVSPCINLMVVATCPANSNCVPVKIGTVGDSSDGVFESTSTGGSSGYLKSGSLTLDDSLLSKQPVSYRRMVTAHEMGHSVSLRHRLTVNDIMNWSSDDGVPMTADATNLNNILAVYGVKSGATTTSLAEGSVSTPGDEVKSWR